MRARACSPVDRRRRDVRRQAARPRSAACRSRRCPSPRGTHRTDYLLVTVAQRPCAARQPSRLDAAWLRRRGVLQRQQYGPVTGPCARRGLRDAGGRRLADRRAACPLHPLSHSRRATRATDCSSASSPTRAWNSREPLQSFSTSAATAAAPLRRPVSRPAARAVGDVGRRGAPLVARRGRDGRGHRYRARRPAIRTSRAGCARSAISWTATRNASNTIGMAPRWPG